MSNFAPRSQEIETPKLREVKTREEIVIEQERKLMEAKLNQLAKMDSHGNELDMVKVANYLSLEQIDELDKYALPLSKDTLKMIGTSFSPLKIRYIGPEYFASFEAKPRKLQLLSEFTESQLDAFNTQGRKGGSILVELCRNKLLSIKELSPEKILVLASARVRELVLTPYDKEADSDWQKLLDTNCNTIHIQ